MACVAAACAGEGPVWVFFRDKGLDAVEERRAVAGLEASANAEQVRRRRARRVEPGLFDARDLPVHAEYVRSVLLTGARRRVESRWLNAVSVWADGEQRRAIEALPFVSRVEPVVRSRRSAAREAVASMAAIAHAAPETDYGHATDQILQLRLDGVHALGFTGSSVIVAVLDTGFVTDHEAFNQPGRELRVIAAYDFVNDDPVVGPEPGDPPGQHQHGTLILGVLGANYPGRLVGACAGARFILCKTEDIAGEYPQEEDFYVAGLEFAEAHGADLATSSLGYIDWYKQSQLNGRTAVTTIGVNVATANGMVCCTAAGNSGHDADPTTSHLLAPADALEVLAVGAVDGSGVIAGFSSDGPTADGRVKPELLARGVSTATIHPDNPSAYARASGTSLSTPLIAGVAACLLDARPAWTVSQVRRGLLSTASDYVAWGGPDPLFIRGYGIADALAALNGACDADFNADGTVDFNDLLEFLNLFNSGNRQADVNRDGVIDFNDLLAFVNLYNAGC
jgi:subtilisin family serine protease